MKRRLISITVFAMIACILFYGCSVKSTGTDQYDRMYDVVNEWNKQSVNQRKDLFGYGEYLYNSYLLLFPRKTPASLTDFHFEWAASMDVDTYSAYFTCQPESKAYDEFIRHLDSFTVSKGGETHTLIKDEEHFDYPAYIIQWLSPGQKWETLEYILADSAKHTLVFVYVTIGGLKLAQEYSSYDIMPNVPLADVVDKSCANMVDNFWAEGFSVYFMDIDDAEYDVSFLDLL